MSLDPDSDSERDAFIQRLLEDASQLKLQELFSQGHPDAIRHVRDRHGVSVVAVRTSSLSEEQLVTIMKYRVAQYLMAGQLDPQQLFAARVQHEPLSAAKPRDVHVIAGDVTSGEILCYATLKTAPDADGTKTLSDSNRWLFPVEEVFGWGVYNRLRILPDLPIGRICEISRFAKNHKRDRLEEVMMRSPVETTLMLCVVHRLLNAEFDAVIGDLEEGVSKKSLDFMHVPTIVLHGAIPYAAEGSFGYLNYQTRTRYACAYLVSDISVKRLEAIEAALDLPGKEGIVALLSLKDDVSTVPSRCQPPGGLPVLADTRIPNQGGAMAARRKLLDLGEWLRGSSLLGSLSVAETAVLGTFMERQFVEAGTVVIHQGEHGDDLYLIETGDAEIQVHTPDGLSTVVDTIGPGEYFGEIALVTDGERTADVVAVSAMSLLRLTRDAYTRYLSHLADVDRRLTRTALVRARENMRATKQGG